MRRLHAGAIRFSTSSSMSIIAVRRSLSRWPLLKTPSGREIGRHNTWQASSSSSRGTNAMCCDAAARTDRRAAVRTPAQPLEVGNTDVGITTEPETAGRPLMPAWRDYRDLALEDAVNELVDVIADRAAYRLLAQEAIHK